MHPFQIQVGSTLQKSRTIRSFNPKVAYFYLIDLLCTLIILSTCILAVEKVSFQNITYIQVLMIIFILFFLIAGKSPYVMKLCFSGGPIKE